jgi:hypothetical protein
VCKYTNHFILRKLFFQKSSLFEKLRAFLIYLSFLIGFNTLIISA